MCTIVSGEVPQEAVVSTKTGQLFEKRLVMKYIADGGKCPINGDDLYESDLIEVKGKQISNIVARIIYSYGCF